MTSSNVVFLLHTGGLAEWQAAQSTKLALYMTMPAASMTGSTAMN